MSRRTMPAQKPGLSKQDYHTPWELIEATTLRLGIRTFAFDFAATARNSKALNHWSQHDDSLTKTAAEWSLKVQRGWGWLNPPFGDIEPWARKCAELKDVGGHVAFLTPLSSADWCKDHVYGKALILALNGRLCFIPNWAKTIDPSTLKKGKGPARCYAAPPLYPKDCMLSLFSPEITPGFEVWNWRQP